MNSHAISAPLKKNFLLILACIFYLFAIFIVQFDKEYTFRWPSFILFIASIGMVTIQWLRSLPRLPQKKFHSYLVPCILLVILTTISRGIYIQEYPFVSLGDQLRDGGLNAQQIYSGQIKKIFAYGISESHGLIIPIISTIFYHFLGSSVLVYRLPAAIFSVLDILVLYVLISVITKNKLIAFIGAYALTCLPLHLFFSRTELVVTLNSFLATVTLLTLFIFLKRKADNTKDYIFFAMITGFIMNFHASLKGLAFISIALLFCINLFMFATRKIEISQFFLRIALVVIFLFVGFGPTVLNTDSSIFFHKTRVPVIHEKDYPISNIFQDISSKYMKSLLVWISEGTTAWYPDHRPILTPVLFGLMIIGIGWSLKEKNLYLIFLLGYMLLIHFTNSAITDLPNGDHRLAPLYPFSAVFIAIGCLPLHKILRFKYLQYIFASILIIYLSTNLFAFFHNQSANLEVPVTPYLSMNSIYFLQANPELLKNSVITFELSPANHEAFQFTHYQEQYQYFFPNHTFNIQVRPEIANNEIFISSASDSEFRVYTLECQKEKLKCPLNSEENITIQYR